MGRVAEGFTDRNARSLLAETEQWSEPCVKGALIRSQAVTMSAIHGQVDRILRRADGRRGSISRRHTGGGRFSKPETT
jgi:hypothetical protein